MRAAKWLGWPVLESHRIPIRLRDRALAFLRAEEDFAAWRESQRMQAMFGGSGE